MGLTGWLRARRSESARAEGLAAGTGLMIGRVADDLVASGSVEVVCPSCGRRATSTDVIDLVEQTTHHHCDACRHRWAAATREVPHRP